VAANDKGMRLHLEQLFKLNVAFFADISQFSVSLTFFTHLGLQGYRNGDQCHSWAHVAREDHYFTLL